MYLNAESPLAIQGFAKREAPRGRSRASRLRSATALAGGLLAMLFLATPAAAQDTSGGSSAGPTGGAGGASSATGNGGNGGDGGALGDGGGGGGGAGVNGGADWARAATAPTGPATPFPAPEAGAARMAMWTRPCR